MSLVVGIDLGTTHSLCAVFQDGQPRLVPNAHGSFLTPSVVGLLEDGSIVIGSAALDLRVVKPERCAWVFKRLMGTDRRIPLGTEHYTAPELSSLVLKSLKHDAEVYFNSAVTEAVVTVPAYFNDAQRKATKLAGELAGLKVRRIINEPTAAALTYGFHDRQATRRLIVVDLGGGTFDVTTMEVFDGTLEITSTAGENFLGGEDFTLRIVAWALEKMGLHLETAELQTPLLVSRLRLECETAKCKLSTLPEVVIRIPNQRGEFDSTSAEHTLTRDEFSRLVDPIIKRLARPMVKAVRDSGHRADEYRDVVLVGGATRMRPVQDYLESFFGVKPLCQFNPDEVVALGAAIQTALMNDDEAVDDMILTDVCPFTLGVEVLKTFGKQTSRGHYHPVIHRNTTVPVSREEILYTTEPNQREVTVKVFQGESRKTADNLYLGELTVTGFPLGPSGQPLHVRFSYDINSILEVEVYVPATEAKFKTVLTQHAKNLSPKEIAAAMARIEKLKFYPRDELKNQRLLLFAERVVGEVNPRDRESLDDAVDQFEAAMASGDREVFEFARAALLEKLAELDFRYDELLEGESGDHAG
jgi:molecular chaperone HscC